jgi:hypothetical protein
MTDSADRHVLADALARLGTTPLNQADDDTLVSLAHEMWYEHANLDTELRLFLQSNPDEVVMRRVGYLLEKMTRFPCMTNDRAFETLRTLDAFLKCYRGEEAVPVYGTRLRDLRDELAASWGLTEGLGAKVQTLLPYQTRHYAAGRNNAFD